MVTSSQNLITYTGTGIVSEYTFPFKITSADQVLIMVFNTVDNTLIFSEKGNALVNVTSVTFDSQMGGVSILLPASLPLDRRLIIKLAVDAPTQTFRFSEQSEFKMRQIENALDYCISAIQTLHEKSLRSLKFDDKGSYYSDLNPVISTLPEADKIVTIASDGRSLAIKGISEIISAGGGGSVPPGGNTGSVLSKASATDGDATWVQHAYSGYSARFSQVFSSTDLADTLTKILNITYTAPSISLAASGSGTVREKGASVASTTLTATVTLTSNPIAEVRFYLSPSTLLDTKTGTIPSGGVETYNYATPFTDTISFYARVDDTLPTTVTSSTVTFTFVYPYYYGAGGTSLTPSQVASLTKDVIVSTATKNVTFTAGSGEVFYFAYPASYPALTSILDVNNFETITDWTASTISITGLDGTSQSYRQYKFNNPVVAGSYYYSFRR